MSDFECVPAKYDGPVRKHPLLRRERFHIWLSSDGRAPFPILPMPSSEGMRELLAAASWDEREASVRFQVQPITLRKWLGGGRPTEGDQEYSVAGIQAAWSALAWATGLASAEEEAS